MSPRKYLAIAGMVLMLGLPAVTRGQETAQTDVPDASVAKCTSEMEERLAQQERMYNDMLFGRHPASTMPLNTVLYDEDGTAWMKSAENTWVRPLSEDSEDTKTRGDADMDDKREWSGQNETPQEGDDQLMPDPLERADYEGVLERREALTSELIPDILQGERALFCRTAAVCETVLQSFARAKTDENGDLKITTPGCRTMVMKPITGCQFSNALESEQERKNLLTGFQQSVVETQCNPLAQQLMERSAALTRVSVSYDAAYRSLLQFSGSLDQFLWGFRGTILSPIEQTLPLLEYLQRIPCFPAQCNA